MRIGQGFDAHRFADENGAFEIRLGGVSIPHNRRVIAHSDGDVLLHALCDALLGALALGDIGQHFPDADVSYRNINSAALLQRVNQMIKQANYRLGNADLTLIAQAPRVAEFIVPMRCALSEALSVALECVSVKATTTEGMGYIGRGEGIAAMAVVLLEAS